jgi:uncharacterized protein (DUF1015 family)
VISEAQRQALLSRSPHNIVRLLLPGTDQNDYLRAGELLEEWRTSGVLVRDDAARFYLYEIPYTDAQGLERMARGVIGALRLSEFGPVIVPHEETIGKHREDRAALIKATRANLDPIMALSAAPELLDLMAQSGGMRLDFPEDDGTHHRVYDLSDPGVMAAIEDAIARHPLSIADGHHRYTTALRYQAAQQAKLGAGPWDFIMTMVSPAEGSGLTIGPYHRLLPSSGIDLSPALKAFDITPTKPSPPERPGTLVVLDAGRSHLLIPKDGALEALPAPLRQSSTAVAVNLLYPLLGLDERGASYVSNHAEALRRAKEVGTVAILVARLTEDAIAAASEAGLRFPSKSTYFSPKPRAGLVVRTLSD